MSDALVHTVKPGGRIDLKRIDSREDGGLTKEEAERRTAELGEELFDLQALMYGARTHSLLIVLQGRDTGGKDGTIKTLSRHVNIQSFRVASFGVPTEEELAHDFLWRVHKQAPAKGHGVVFNRSHYEDVLVVRVHSLVPERVWSKRYDLINHFEQLLAQNDTIVLKFMLHISKEEQEERLLEREREPEKAWKLSAGDWKEREHWDAYTEAYNAALSHCSTAHAPWHIVAADRKWYRDLAVMTTVVEALRPYRKKWMDKLDRMGKEAKAELEDYRRG